MGLGGRGGGVKNKQRKGVEIFIKFNKWEGVQNKQGGWDFKLSINKRDRNV